MKDIEIAEELLAIAKKLVVKDMNNDTNWSEAVSFILNELFFGQCELAKRCGASQQSVQQWKNKTCCPRTEKQQILTDILREAGVSMEKFNATADKPITDAGLIELIDTYKQMTVEKQTELMEFARERALEWWCPMI